MKKEAEFVERIWDAIKSFFTKSVDETEKSELDLANEQEEEVADIAQKIEEKGIAIEEPPIENEILVQDVDVEEGEVEVNEYRMNLPPDLQARLGDPDVDHSFTALIYLFSLGYQTVEFMLNPAEDREYDICDELAKGGSWDLAGILAGALDDAAIKGYPVAPLFYLSHPNCMCYLHVRAPDNPEGIPDSAPGLHMWGDPEKILAEKEELWYNLPSIVEVDRGTMAPEIFETVKNITGKDNSLIKKANKESWVEEIKPIRIKENIFLKQPPGLIQVINKGAKGFQLETYNEIAKVFLYEFGREMYIPINSYDILSLSLSNKADPNEGDYIVADEEDIAIAYGMVDDELLVYDPDYNNVVRIDEWRVLEIV